jgi:hypothetical protein
MDMLCGEADVKWLLLRAIEYDPDIPQLIIHNLDRCFTAACGNLCH